MDDCGSLRCEMGEDLLEGELVREAVFLGGGEVVEGSRVLLAAVLFLSVLRGASLIRPASLRWWSSSRLRMRRAWGVLDV